MKLLRISRTKSRCNVCPLDGYCTKVRGESANERPKIAFIGEAPGAEEDRDGHPFVGSAGQELNRVLSKAGLHRHNAYLLNLINCRPPENNLESPEGQEALVACSPGFEEEIRTLHGLGVRTLVPLGAAATSRLGIEGSVHKVRGSVYEVVVAGLKFWAVPTFHPSYIIRGSWEEEPTMIADVEKATNIALNGYTPPKEDFLLFPTVRDIELRTKDILRKKPLLGVDIETTGKTWWTGEIFVLSFALNGTEAFSVPFYSQGYKPYWHNGDLVRVMDCLKAIFTEVPTMFQNATGVDLPFIDHHICEVKNVAHDVLLIHHAIHPELPHNLGYIVSIYGATPYWKDIRIPWQRIGDMDDTELRTYNCRDSVVLHQVLPSLLADLKDTGTEHIYYDYSLRLIRPTLSITYNGMLLDRKRLLAWKRQLEKDLATHEGELRKLGGLPDEFNFQSPHHLSFWFYGEKPSSLPTWEKEIASYDEEGSRKKKASAKYQGLCQRVVLYQTVHPLARSKSKTKRTKTGFAKDEKALLLSKLAATTEIELVSKYRRPTPEHKARLAELTLLRDALTLFQKRQKTAKLLSTYTTFETGPDGRVHPQFKIHGTATGRLSSGEDEE